MSSARIIIDHDPSLAVNSTTNNLTVAKSFKTGSTLEFKNDGLYARQSVDTYNTGFRDGYRSNNGIISGITSPIDSTAYSNRIVSPSITHRIFTCSQPDGQDIVLRECDLILPGDMYRVHDEENHEYKYYLVLKSNGTQVTATVLDNNNNPLPVAVIPDTDPCN